MSINSAELGQEVLPSASSGADVLTQDYVSYDDAPPTQPYTRQEMNESGSVSVSGESSEEEMHENNGKEKKVEGGSVSVSGGSEAEEDNRLDTSGEDSGGDESKEVNESSKRNEEMGSADIIGSEDVKGSDEEDGGEKERVEKGGKSGGDDENDDESDDEEDFAFTQTSKKIAIRYDEDFREIEGEAPEKREIRHTNFERALKVCVYA